MVGVGVYFLLSERRGFVAYPHARTSGKRDLLKCQKRPTTVSKETYYSVKRDLLQCQKRPTTHTCLTSFHTPTPINTKLNIADQH